MSDASTPKTPLGVGKLLSEAMGLFFSRLVPIVLLALIPTFVGTALTVLGVMSAMVDPLIFSTNPTLAGVSIVVAVALAMLSYVFATGMVVQLSFDHKLNQPIRMGAYVSRLLRVLLWLVLWTIVLLLISGLAFVVIGGAGAALIGASGSIFGPIILFGGGFVAVYLFLMAAFYVLTPVVVLEKGPGALGRCLQLTKGYRWPILGLIAMFMIFAGIMTVVIGFVLGFVVELIGGGVWGDVIVQSVTSAIPYGLGGVMVALTYARLREIKDGLGLEEIANVFD